MAMEGMQMLTRWQWIQLVAGCNDAATIFEMMAAGGERIDKTCH